MTGLRTPSPPVPPIRRPVVLGVAALAVVAMAFAVGVGSLTRESGFVPVVTVDNPTPYNLQVDVGAAGGGEVLGLGSVPREDSRPFEQVVDQGQQWVFRVSFGGEVVADVAVPRAQLEQDGWRVTVPAEVGQELADAGHPPSAL